MYGHVEKLAEEIKKGAASVEDVESKLWQVPETLQDEVLGKMSAPPKSDAPIITPNELAEADGFIFGFPTRFGMMAAQFKASVNFQTYALTFHLCGRRLCWHLCRRHSRLSVVRDIKQPCYTCGVNYCTVSSCRALKSKCPESSLKLKYLSGV